MNKIIFSSLLAGCLTLSLPSSASAASLLSPNDFIISIDTDPFGSFSAYPEQESPAQAGDGIVETKYLNFGKTNTGFIVEPFVGSTTIQSMLLTTANDFPERDPASWKIFGTNDPITSVDNGTGDAENWSLIAEGDVMLPEARDTAHTPISFSNSTAYSAYRVLFPTVKDAPNANSMQIAEVGLFESSDATGSSVWDDFDFPLAFQLPSPTGTYNGGEGPASLLDGTGGTGMSTSASPAAESADKIVDGSVAKYLNFGKENSGFIAISSDGPKQLQSFKFFTANDFEGRDPASFEVYGTNDFVVSGEHSLGTAENWTLIDSGSLAFPPDRDSFTPVTTITNPNAYNAYKMIFPTLKDTAGENVDSMQIGEAFFFEDTIGAGINDFLDPTDTLFAIDEDEVTGLDTKFLNLGGENGGFIVTPAIGSSTIDSFQVSTANDFPERDPATWELWGSNEAIASEDTERGDGENWTLIDSGTFTDLQVPMDRLTVGEVITVSNSTEYASYRMIFPTIRDNTEQDQVQLSGVEFFGDAAGGTPGDYDNDGDVDGDDFLEWQRGNSPNSGSPADLAAWQAAYDGGGALASGSAVPEPTTLVLVAFSTLGLVAGTRRRDLGGSISRR